MKLSTYKDLLIFWIWTNIFILSFIPVGHFCYFLSTMIKAAASLCSVESAKPAEQSFRDLILAYGDHEIFKQFHSLGPAGVSQATSARWRLNQLLIWRGMGMPVLWCWGLDLFLLFSLPPFDSRDLVSVEDWLYKESRKWRDSINSERHSSRTKASHKRNVSGS